MRHTFRDEANRYPHGLTRQVKWWSTVKLALVEATAHNATHIVHMTDGGTIVSEEKIEVAHE